MNGLYSKLDQFLARLPDGFEYGVPEQVAVSELVLRLAGSGELPRDPDALKTLLAPVMCSTREQQREFYRLFDAENWRGAGGRVIRDPPLPPEEELRIPPRRRWLKVAGIFAAIAVVALAGAGGLAWYRLTRRIPVLGWSPPTPRYCYECDTKPQTLPVTGRVVGSDGAQLEGAEVWIPGQSQKTSPDGTFEFKSAPAGSMPLLVAHPRYRSFMGFIGGTPLEVKLQPWTETPRPVVGSLTQAGEPRRFSMGDPVTMAINPADYLVAVTKDSRIQVFHFGAPKQIAQSLGPWIRGARFVFSPNGANVLRYTSTDISGPNIEGEVYDPSLARTTAAAVADAEPTSALTGFSDGSIENLHDVVHETGKYSLGSISEPVEAITYLPPSTGPNLTALIAGRSGFWLLNYSPPKLARSLRKLYSSQREVPIAAIQVDPGNRYLGIQDRDGTLDIWDFYGQRVRTPPGWPRNVEAFSFSSQSNVVERGVISLWIATVDRRLLARLRSLRWLAAILPAIAIAAWLWWLVRKRGRLNRLSIDRDLDTHSLSPPQAEPPFNGAPARRLGLEMRKRKRAPSSELAPSPTVDATSRSAGFLTPVYATRSRQREFLFLIQRHGPGDQQELLYRSLARSLESEYVLIEIYTFHSSPDAIEDSAGGWIDLAELSARHPDHELWIIAAPAEFLDPFATSLPPWTQHLARWQSRAIFSPVEVEDALRNLLEDDGVWVGTASAEGLAAVLASLDGEHAPRAVNAPVLPKVFRYLPLRWIERVTPGESAVQQAMDALPRFLGADGMLLAGACSVYPETFWGLTSWLAQALIPSQDRRAGALASLTSLPWFHFATIPNWMRAKLVNAVSDADKAGVRVLIETFLEDAKNKAGELRVVRAGRGRSGQVRDYVMFSFLLGRKVDENLAVKPPSRWLWLLFEGGRWLFGPRILSHTGLAIALGIAFWFAAGYAIAFVPARVEVTQWILPRAAPTVTPPARVFPANPVQRVMLEVADAMVGSASGVAFEDTVVRRATDFIDNAVGTRTSVDDPRPAPGLAYNGGIIESVSGNRMVNIEAQQGKVVRVDRTVPAGPFRRYLGLDREGAPPESGQCSGPDITLFDNWNGGAVANGGKPVTIDFTKLKPSPEMQYCLVSISTYHWNGGLGAAPGRITLRRTKGAQVGSWEAVGSSGTNNAPNVNWVASVPTDKPILLNDSYTVEDSSPATWSENGESRGLGFLRVHVRQFVPATSGDWKVVKRLMGHQDLVSDVAWSPDGRMLASGSSDHTVRVWEAASGREISRWSQTTNGVESLAWSPDGKTLASAGMDGAIRIGNPATDKLIRVLDARSRGIYSISWSADGKMLASGGADGRVRIWDPATGQLVRASDPVKGEIYRVAFHPDGKILASSGEDDIVRYWNVNGFSQPLATLLAHGLTLAWNPSGAILSTADANKIIHLLTNNDQQIRTLQGHTDQIDALAWSPDGRILASSSRDKTVRLWNPANGQLLATLKDHTDRATGLAWSPDGKQLASASGDRTILIYSQALQNATAP